MLVDFWAPWCGPCRMLGPVLEKLEGAYAGRFILGKINVDDNGSIAEKYSIMSIPNVKLFKSGKVVDEFVARVGLEILLSQSQSGTFNSRTQKQFHFSKNSHKIFYSQSGLFRNSSDGLRSCNGFQISLPSTSIPELDNLYTSRKSFSTTSRMGSPGELQSTSTAFPFSLSGYFPICSKSSYKNKTFDINFGKFANELLYASVGYV